MASDSSLLDRQAWPSRTLREANVILIDCDHRTPPAQEQGYPYVTIPQLKNGRIELSSSRRISPEHYVEWARKAKPSPYDVVLSRRCNPGETAFVSPDMEFALGQNLVLLRADGSEVYPPFLRWLVRGPEWWSQIKTFLNVGAVFESLRCADIPKFTLTIPPLDEQKVIADFLGSLDAKIETIQRQNALMEELARTIFKSWFVDFDPVRAKAEGREPEGMDAATAALFPNEFQESEVGLIPYGWSVSTIKDLARNIQYGFTTSAKAEAIGPKFLRITDIQGGQVNWSKVPYCIASEAEYDRYRLKPHDIVVARTGASTGENIYLPVVPDAVFASYLVRFQFDHPAVARLVGAFMRTTAYFDFVQNSIGGSAQPNASAQVLAGAKLVLPTPVLLRQFAEIVEQLDEKLWHNVTQSITLADLRDNLLPRLISGKLRVPEAEAMLTGGCREV